MLQDLRFAVRNLRLRPGFSVFIILTLALGIGATTSIFSLVDAVLLRPLPFPHSGQLVTVWEDASHIGFPRNTPSPGNYFSFKNESRTFQDMAAISWQTYNLTGEGEPVRLEGRRVTANLFGLLGVEPLRGRSFTAEDDAPESKLAIIGYSLWQAKFGGRDGTVGAQIELNGEPHTVIGIMPRGFGFPTAQAQLWTPMGFTEEQKRDRRNHYLVLVGRLKHEANVEQARSDLEAIAARLRREFPETNANVGARVIPLRDFYTSQVRTGFLVLFAAVAALLLIACANIANLLLVRASGRRQEIAVRAALGAGRWRLLRQMLTESLALALAGGLLGVLAARLSFDFLVRLVPAHWIGQTPSGLDWRLLAFTAAVAILTGIVFGLLPALRASRLDVAEELQQGGRGGGGRRGLQKALVVAEVALALVLLVGAGLLIKTLAELQGLDPGFRTENVLTMRMDLPASKYSEPEPRNAFYSQVVERVEALPGVRSAGFSTFVPLTLKGGSMGYQVASEPVPQPGEVPDANVRVVTPGYFEAMGIALRRGRAVRESDRLDSPRVAVVNETLAKRHWPGGDAVGRRLQFGRTREESAWREVVGVVSDVRQMGLENPPRAEVYIPYRQWRSFSFFIPRELAVHTEGDPLALADSVRAAVWDIDPQQPISNVRPMSEIVSSEFQGRRSQMALLAAFAALALLLASLGIYGVLSFAVSQKRREIGIRLAVGASPRDVLREMAGHAAVLVALGLALGLASSFALTRLMSTLLFQVAPQDPSTLIASAATLTLVAAMACWRPVRRASRVDASAALRAE